MGEKTNLQFLRPPTYFECKRILKRLRRFQGLIAHKEMYAIDMQFAPPIEELLPNVPKQSSNRYIDREINRLIPLVGSYLYMSGIPTEITAEWTKYDKNMEEKIIERKYDLVGHYFELLHQGSGQPHELLRNALEQAIGYYEMRKERAFIELFNPLTWVALVLRAPNYVRDRAGLTNEKTNSTIEKIFFWSMRILFGIILLFIAAKLGISISRDDVLKWIK